MTLHPLANSNKTIVNDGAMGCSCAASSCVQHRPKSMQNGNTALSLPASGAALALFTFLLIFLLLAPACRAQISTCQHRTPLWPHRSHNG